HLKKSWDCDLASVEKLCSPLSKWMRYRYWQAVVQSGYKKCWWNFLKKDKVNFPFKGIKNCAALEQCIHKILKGPDGAVSFFYLQSYPQPESTWTKFYENICSLLQASRSCELESAESNCSPLTKWMTDQYWQNLIQVVFLWCWPALKNYNIEFPS
ncbi:hypothetical protein PoB_007273300, partial [Plakobranchus ocellatus]